MEELISKNEVMRKFAAKVWRSNHSDLVPPPTWNDAVQIVDSAEIVERRNKQEGDRNDKTGSGIQR